MTQYNIPLGISEFEKIRKNDYSSVTEDGTCRDYTFYKTPQIWKDACDEYVGIFL